jgi:CRP-like cAMP-binding protein
MAGTSHPQQNHILDALPQPERDRLFPYLQLVTLPLGKVLYESGDTLRHIYFPTNSIVSLLYVLKDGESAEIAVVGNEGAMTKPTFGFPQNMQALFPAIHNGGTMVNGVHVLPSAFVLEKTDTPY